MTDLRRLVAPCASLAFLVACSLSVPAQISPGYLNLLAGRGDFEGDWSGDGVADKWIATYNASVFTPSVTNSTSATGLKCQRVIISKNNSSTYSFNYNTDISTTYGVLRPGSRITFSFQYKTSTTVTNIKWKIWQNWTKTNGTNGYRELQTLVPLTAETAWKTWTGEMTIPDDTKSVVIGIYLYTPSGASSGTFYLDNVKATDGRLAPAPVAKSFKLTSLYSPLSKNDWINVARYMDGLAWHAWEDYEAVGSLRSDFKSMHFVRTAYLTNVYSESPENPIAYSWIQANHPEWFMRDMSNNIISYNGQTSLDVGNVAYQDMLLSKLQLMCSNSSMKALFLDYFDTDAAGNMLNLIPPKGYTNATWQAAVTAMLTKLQPLRTGGMKLYANVAHASYNQAPGTTWLGLLDGMAMEWGFVMMDRQGVKLYGDWNSWKNKFLWINNAPTLGKTIFIGHSLPDTWVNERRFALGSFLCAMQPDTYIAFHRNFEEPVWFPEFAAPLGSATGGYQVVQGDWNTGALIMRPFTNGLVFLNATDTTTYIWTNSATYQDLDGNLVQPGNKSIGPKSALILLKAPNVRLTMSATPTTAAPGEFITYRVDYQNTGTANSVNTYISAPVPIWTTFYSATGGGSYDSVGKKVIWNLASVPAGSTGYVTFKVRVN